MWSYGFKVFQEEERGGEIFRIYQDWFDVE